MLHITSGSLGVLAGFTAVFLRKGSRQHGIAGNVFVAAMMSLAISATFLAIPKGQVTNVLGAALTFYLVTTAWATVRRTGGETGTFEWLALLLALAVGGVEITFGAEAALSTTGLKYGYPAAIYLVFGMVALLAAAGDIRLLLRGNIAGRQRLARHLWRMCFALFIASSSIFIARPQLFPPIFQKSGLLAFLSFLPLLLLIFWSIRIRFRRSAKDAREKPWNIPGAVGVSTVGR
jgi:uncharacterized membrane protein